MLYAIVNNQVVFIFGFFLGGGVIVWIYSKKKFALNVWVFLFKKKNPNFITLFYEIA